MDAGKALDLNPYINFDASSSPMFKVAILQSASCKRREAHNWMLLMLQSNHF